MSTEKKLHVKKIEPKVVEFGGVNVLVSEGMTPEEIMAAYENARVKPRSHHKKAPIPV
jgi:hypothetical protein